MTILTSNRLKLRPATAADAARIAALMNDWDVVRTLANVPYPYSLADAENWLAQISAAAVPAEVYAIERHNIGLVGIISLSVIASDPSGEQVRDLGYWLGKRHWGEGITTEAAATVIKHGFDNLGLDEIISSALHENSGSLKVQDKVGFELIGDGHQFFSARNEKLAVRRVRMDRDLWAKVSDDLTARYGLAD